MLPQRDFLEKARECGQREPGLLGVDALFQDSWGWQRTQFPCLLAQSLYTDFMSQLLVSQAFIFAGFSLLALCELAILCSENRALYLSALGSFSYMRPAASYMCPAAIPVAVKRTATLWGVTDWCRRGHRSV